MSTDRSVLITGGEGGIGKALVKRFSGQGYAVWSVDIGTKEDSGEPGHPDVRKFDCDLGNPESIKKLLSDLPGDVDILINNAGLGSKTVEQYTDNIEQQDVMMMQVNALAPLWLTQAVLMRMKENSFGKVIFMSSVGGGITQFPGFRYSDGMSKAALTHLCKQMTAELAHDPIDVFTVCPGATNTKMLQASTLNKLSEKERAAMMAALPLRRLIEPEEIADLCFFLCTKEATVLLGAVLDASLGLGCHPGLMPRP